MKCSKDNPCDICQNAINTYLFSNNTNDLRVGTLTYVIEKDGVNLGSILYDIYINSSWIPINYTSISSTSIQSTKSYSNSDIYNKDIIYKDMAQLIKHVHKLTKEVEYLRSQLS